MSTAELPTLKPKDYKSDQEVRWCPGCGDYSILLQLQKVCADLRLKKENTVFVSGIGCSSRFPYYMETYAVHGIHGRAPAIATRRNVNLKIILFNNRIYGLTKGQYSPTSELGKKTKSSPMGTVDYPMHPLCIAIGAEATFVARSVDVDVKHLQETLRRAALHRGTAYVEVYQDCNVFNHDAFAFATERSVRDDNLLYLEHGKPMIFGKERNKGIRLNGTTPEVVQLGAGVTADDLLIHDEKAPEPTLAYLLSRMRYPEFPEPVGVFRAVEQPTYDDMVMEQVRAAEAKHGQGDLMKLFNSGETWTVN
ncbi:MAG: 2-oxoacid:ferredoxin oxidoreductase subunit beta [Planctomycetes bacterium]|nr:2-oxoacid:ferredoxin oxidoreductase subunit beta [Planctomycetota bacterium]